MAAADPAKPADKSAKKRSSLRVSRFLFARLGLPTVILLHIFTFWLQLGQSTLKGSISNIHMIHLSSAKVPKLLTSSDNLSDVCVIGVNEFQFFVTLSQDVYDIYFLLFCFRPHSCNESHFLSPPQLRLLLSQLISLLRNAAAQRWADVIFKTTLHPKSPLKIWHLSQILSNSCENLAQI